LFGVPPESGILQKMGLSEKNQVCSSSNSCSSCCVLMSIERLDVFSVKDGRDVVRLFHIIHPNSKSATEASSQAITDDQQLISVSI